LSTRVFSVENLQLSVRILRVSGSFPPIILTTMLLNCSERVNMTTCLEYLEMSENLADVWRSRQIFRGKCCQAENCSLLT